MGNNKAPKQLVEEAVSLIWSAQLPVAEHKILSFFIHDAVDPNHAAQYLLKCVSGTGNFRDTEDSLRQFKDDWRQLTDRLKRHALPLNPNTPSSSLDSQCCITGKTGPWWDVFGLYGVSPVYIIPPTFLEGPQMAPGSRLYELLGAFITPSQRDRLSFITNGLSDQPIGAQSHRDYDLSNDSQLENVLVMEPDSKEAFRNGRFQILPFLEEDWNGTSITQVERVKKAEYQLLMVLPVPYPTITNQSGRHLRILENLTFTTDDLDQCPLPSPFLLSVHSRFCNSMRWFQVEDEVKKGWPRESFWKANKAGDFDTRFRSPSWLSQAKYSVFRVLRATWLTAPHPMRILCYNALYWVGSRIYSADLPWVQRVPFGLYIKRGQRKLISEHEHYSLSLVERHTVVPSPKLIERTKSGDYTYLVMTRVSGRRAKEVFHLLSYGERSQLATDLRSCVTEFRRIPNDNSAGYTICNSLGGPAFDYRLPGDSVGPFHSEQEFNRSLVQRDDLKDAVACSHSRSHEICFSHADLSPLNILIQGGRLAGIVDFGCSGFYPEYWEYTKCMYDFWASQKGWADLINETFGTSYCEELRAEQTLWEHSSPW